MFLPFNRLPVGIVPGQGFKRRRELADHEAMLEILDIGGIFNEGTTAGLHFAARLIGRAFLAAGIRRARLAFLEWHVSCRYPSTVSGSWRLAGISLAIFIYPAVRWMRVGIIERSRFALVGAGIE